MAINIGTLDEAGGVEGMRKLIYEYRGNLAAMGRFLQVHRTSVLRAIENYPELVEAMTDARRTTFELVEDQLESEALKGNMLAIMFYLKCNGQRMGKPYNDRQQQDEGGGEKQSAPLTVDEWQKKRISQRAHVAAMLEDFSTIDGEVAIPAEIVPAALKDMLP
jgi:hypothetical protein